MFAIAGTGFYLGRNTKSAKISSYKTSLNERLAKLEDTVDNNFDLVSRRIDKIEEQQKRANQNQDNNSKAKKRIAELWIFRFSKHYFS